MANLFKDLPHAGTITNLDGAQSMRAQPLSMGDPSSGAPFGQYESTISTNTKRNLNSVKRPNLPHLFLISVSSPSKVNQPDFIKELVSIARDRGSLGYT